MPQSLSKVIIHIIFSTKDREPWLDREVRPRMQAYVATICRDLNAEAVRVGGVADHLHLVTMLPRTLSQADRVEAVTKTSSNWIKSLDRKYRGLLLAARLRRILSKSQSARCRSEIFGEPGRASSDPQFSGGVSRFLAQVRRRIRRTLRLGLKRAATL